MITKFNLQEIIDDIIVEELNSNDLAELRFCPIKN